MKYRAVSRNSNVDESLFGNTQAQAKKAANTAVVPTGFRPPAFLSALLIAVCRAGSAESFVT
jgi:hypothetical protein